ncbi:hypothetical protein BDF20DRAFT_838144 [Mycotypha africana]|uniref:uncharacterized protein n=1 Tax=Mycotypha africana TaxID=64632 RepID=UPI002300882D|nr:uncharacterized protein BDF20DRAFT_838144 [Mycotypha africana]KAI8971866.1 hypothetical protein BDF20DRAFT_838144 [Mycotypha africana]
MNHDTLNQQTAPESTRGLFDAPAVSLPSSNVYDKRRTIHGLSSSQLESYQYQNNRYRQPISLMPTPRHQRSRSNINPEIIVSSSRSTNSLSYNNNNNNNTHLDGNNSLNTANNNSNAVRNRRSFMGLHTLKEEMTVDSLQNMINTLKTLPPIISPSSSSPTPPPTSATANSDGSNLERRPSDENTYISREAALAEAEAKLMGTFNRREDPMKKRASLQQLPVLNEYGDSFMANYNSSNINNHSKRGSMNSKSLSLSLGGSNSTDRRSSLNRRSSRNFDDWRNSSASFNSTGNIDRSSFSFVPFTPTRVNFSRDDANPHQRRPLFIAHLPFSALTPLFRGRQLVRGILRVNKRNRSDAYVTCDELDGEDIYICGSRDRNRALEGDVVAVRLVNVEKVIREKQEKEEAKLARNNGQPKARLPDEEDENEIIFGGDEEVDVVKPKYAGVVVAILERAQNQVFSGTLTLSRPNNKRAALQQQNQQENGNGYNNSSNTKKEAPRIVWFKATDKRVPLIAIPIEQIPEDFVENNEAYNNRLFVGSIKRWPITSLHPFGTLERELGPITDLEVQIKAILADNNISDAPFSDAVMECVPPRPFEYIPPEDGSRRNLTVENPQHRMITIDPVGSTIFEDGLSIVRLGDDTFEAGLHVVDIAHFITPHSFLDKEARARAVHVHLDQKSVPMVPKELVDLANFSLNDLKPAVSVIWKLSSKGIILDTWVGKTVVRSSAQLTYEDAQNIVDGKDDDRYSKEISEDVRMLYNMALNLHQLRYTRDAMSLARKTLCFDNVNQPTSVYLTEAKSTIVKIVKEFSFMANRCIAQKISSQYPDQALLRCQDPPNSRKIHDLRDYALRYLGIPLKIQSAAALQQSVQNIKDEELRQLISVLVLKTMQPPKYFCTGAFDILKYAHFASGVPLFTHFTAPLRRYADIIVHRQLEATISGDKHFYLDRDTVQKLAQHCNVKKAAGFAAREQSKLLSLALYLVYKQTKQHMPNDPTEITTVYSEARVIAVMDDYFDVSLPEFGLERRIHLANLPLWRHQFDPQERALTMYWKQGLLPSTGQPQQWSLSDDEYEEEELLTTTDNTTSTAYPEKSRSNSSTAERTISTASSSSTSLSTTDDNRSSLENNKEFQAIALAAAKAGIVSSEASANGRKSATKRASIISSRLSTSTGYSTEQCSQTIKALDKIRVMLTVEMIKTPPLIRVFAANPYA